jgi:nicotinamide-nucleotide amidase
MVLEKFPTNFWANIFQLFFLVKAFILTYNGSMSSEIQVAKRLLKYKKTLAVAESCSGGLLAHKLTNIAGSSAFLMGGLVTYSNASKIRFLRVPALTIKKYGAVSRQTAIAMAQNVRTLFKVDYGLAITGIAGPSGGTKTKPVGLTYIALSTADETACLEFHFKGNRLQNKAYSADETLKLLLKHIKK